MWMCFIINNNGVRIGSIVGYDGIDIGIIDFVVNCYIGRGGIDIGIGNGRSSAGTIETDTLVATLHVHPMAVMATGTVAARRRMAMATMSTTTAAATTTVPSMTSSSAARNESLIGSPRHNLKLLKGQGQKSFPIVD